MIISINHEPIEKNVVSYHIIHIKNKQNKFFTRHLL